MTSRINIDELENYCNDLIYSWRRNYGIKQYDLCKEDAQKIITEIKPIYKERLYGEGKEAGQSYNFMYIIMLLAKAFEDITTLAELTSDKNWPDDNSKTEIIWQVLWDAKERLDIFESHYSDKDTFQDLYQQLKKLEHFFYDLFGKGIYMSPVILVKKATCTICEMNIKGCMHIPGKLYNGKVCREKADKIQFQGADFVESPHDMRCRVWPWNFIDKQRVNVRIMNLNQLDGFIEEN